MNLIKLTLTMHDGFRHTIITEYSDIDDWLTRFDMERVKSVETTVEMTPYEWTQFKGGLRCRKSL